MNLYLCRANGNGTEISKLLDVVELEKFVELMKDRKALNFKPSTRKEKLYRIKLAIKFIRRTIENEQLYQKASRVIDAIDEWCHGLSKDISIQRKDHGLMVREKLPHLQDPNEFLHDEEV